MHNLVIYLFININVYM